MLLGTHAHAEVHDGEQAEDEGLNGADKELVEGLPDGQADPRQVRRDQGDDHRDHQHAGEDVAEKSEGHGDGLGDLFNDVDRRQRGIGLTVVLDIALEAPGLDGVDVHQDEDDQGQGQREVDVARRRSQEARIATGDEGQPVADEDEEEDGYAQTDEGPSLGPDGRVGQVGHLLGECLPEELQLAGHTVGDLAHHEEGEGQHDGGGDQRGPDHVEINGQAGDLDHAVVGTDGDVAAGQDHLLGGDQVHFSPDDMTTRPTLTTKRIWKMTSPITLPIPSGPFRNRSPMQMAVMMASRVTLLVPMARRRTLRSVSPLVCTLATPASRKRKLRMARPRPMKMPSAAQGCESSRAMMMAPSPTMMAEITVRRSTLARAVPSRSERPDIMLIAPFLQVLADVSDHAGRRGG